MLRIHFTDADVSRVTIAEDVDASWETLFSLHLLQEPDEILSFDHWRRRIRAEIPAWIPLLLELAPPRGYSADFLTPGRGDADSDTVIDRIMSTPRRRLRDDVACLADRRPPTPWTRKLADGDVTALRQLGTALDRYYRRAVAPYRGRLRAHVEADRSRRGKALLTGGVDRLLATLHPRVEWRPPVLRVLDYVDQDLHLDGRGLVLLPSHFCRHHPVTLKDADLPPVLAYPVNSGFAWLTPDRPAMQDPVTSLLGRTRAATLRASTTAVTTTDLARRIGLSPPSASKHARVLREAGLITTRRDGGAVVHQVSGLGVAVLNGELPA
ncbi:ArsR family transcriptional regulator [Amycolatopsis sp. WAC 04197]|nr:ArsR family transcriptional regulator [Amycolatopsis sp. WAC 04197]